MKVLSRALPVVAGAVAGGVIALAVSSGGNTTHSVTTTVVQPSSSPLPTSFAPSRGLTINQIYRKDSPGVVDIIVSESGGVGAFGQPAAAGTGEGAGVLYDNRGDILTDEHVVANATSVKVNFSDGRSYGAKVLGKDASTDVAVIRVNAPASELHPIPLANSADAQVGDPVVAIGSPFSYPGTTTGGIVSAVGRSITAPNNFTITGAIQTDAAINPGNSGGPLLDATGAVLGLNDQIQTNSGSSAGVGFAIPSDMVAHIANEIISGAPVRHAWVGVQLNGASTGGARISQQANSVEPGSPAANAGLQAGDLVTAIDGKTISSTQQFIETINNYDPGRTVSLTVQRGGKTLHISLKLGVRPNTPAAG